MIYNHPQQLQQQPQQPQQPQPPIHRSYQLIFISKRNIICERILEEEGVIGSIYFLNNFCFNLFSSHSSLIAYTEISIGDFAVDFIPLEKDLLSLEINHCYRSLYLVKQYIQCSMTELHIHRMETLLY